MTEHVTDRGHSFKCDKCNDGWELVEDVGFSLIDPTKLELISFLKTGETFITGTEMARRAKEELRADLGQRDAEYLLELEYQQKIPKEFRQYYIVFPGTGWRGPGGRRFVAYLYWYGGQWILDFRWLEGAWNSGDRLARPRE